MNANFDQLRHNPSDQCRLVLKVVVQFHYLCCM